MAEATDGTPVSGTGRVRVAVVGPFSGRRAAWGRLLTRAARTHSGITWDFHDDRGDADLAVPIAEALVADAGYPAVIGHFNSTGAGRALRVYRRAGLPLLLPLATAPDLLRGGGGGALRWCPHDQGQLKAIRSAAYRLGHATLDVTDDGSDYGRRLAALFRALPAHPAPARSGSNALLICGTHYGAAATARRLRAEGIAGHLFFTDDCAVDGFADLLGADVARHAHVAGPRSGAYAWVDAAFSALVRALDAEPSASGDRLLAAVRDHAGIRFDQDGDPVDAEEEAGWEVRRVASGASTGTAAGAAHDQDGDEEEAGREVRRVARGLSSRTAAGAARGHDVVVVGAGVVGAATAAALTTAGLSVAIASDAPGPGAGSATRWSGGLVRAYEADPVIRSLAVRSYQLLWGAAPDTAPSCGVQRTGALVLLGPDDLAEAERGMRELSDAGIKAALLAPGEIRSRWPDLAVRSDDGVAAALWEPDGGYADPVRTAALYRTRALRRGAALLPPSPVLAVEEHRQGVRIVTAAGSLVARSAVIAAGSGTPALLGERLPARLGVAEPRTKRIRYAFFAHGGRVLPTVVDLTTGMWGRPQLSGPMAGGQLTGRPVEEWDVPATGGAALTDEEVAYIRDGAVRRWPWVAEARYLGGRFGADLYHPEGPYLGALPGTPRLVVAACWSGAGFKTAPAAAATAAAAVSNVLGQ